MGQNEGTEGHDRRHTQQSMHYQYALSVLGSPMKVQGCSAPREVQAAAPRLQATRSTARSAPRPAAAAASLPPPGD